MNRIIALLLLFCAISPIAIQPASAAVVPTISTVPVGSASNAPDQLYLDHNPDNLVFGAVARRKGSRNRK